VDKLSAVLANDRQRGLCPWRAATAWPRPHNLSWSSTMQFPPCRCKALFIGKMGTWEKRCRIRNLSSISDPTADPNGDLSLTAARETMMLQDRGLALQSADLGSNLGLSPCDPPLQVRPKAVLKSASSNPLEDQVLRGQMICP
jgi:hypothetical protein